jgi:hypothetical protein
LTIKFTLDTVRFQNLEIQTPESRTSDLVNY